MLLVKALSGLNRLRYRRVMHPRCCKSARPGGQGRVSRTCSVGTWALHDSGQVQIGVGGVRVRLLHWVVLLLGMVLEGAGMMGNPIN